MRARCCCRAQEEARAIRQMARLLEARTEEGAGAAPLQKEEVLVAMQEALATQASLKKGRLMAMVRSRTSLTVHASCNATRFCGVTHQDSRLIINRPRFQLA